MASIQKRTTKSGDLSYRVQVRLKGHPTETASFERLTDARKWAQHTGNQQNTDYFKSTRLPQQVWWFRMYRRFDEGGKEIEV